MAATLIASKVIVCGSRDWTDADMIRRWLAKLPKLCLVIHGACRGADQMADREARRMGLTTRPFVAEWDRLGRGAGPARNRKMLLQQPDLVLAFSSRRPMTPGTADMVGAAKDAGVAYKVMYAREA